MARPCLALQRGGRGHLLAPWLMGTLEALDLSQRNAEGSLLVITRACAASSPRAKGIVPTVLKIPRLQKRGGDDLRAHGGLQSLRSRKATAGHHPHHGPPQRIHARETSGSGLRP